MRYLEHLDPRLRPSLEAIVLDAQLKFPLGGHPGPESARSAALPYVRSACSECATELCRAVERGQIPYSELTGSLEALREGIIREAYNKAELPYWERYSDRADYDSFKREALNWLEHSEEWRVVQTARVRLARESPVVPVSVATCPSSFDSVMADARRALERSQKLSHRLGFPSSDSKNASVNDAKVFQIQQSAPASPPPDAEQPAAEDPGPYLTTADYRRAQVDDFLRRCNLEPDLPCRIWRKHIWLSVSHRTARQFEYWQAASAKATPEDHKNFSRVLNQTPSDFIAQLVQLKLLKRPRN
jgi:hypothetical protein